MHMLGNFNAKLVCVGTAQNIDKGYCIMMDSARIAGVNLAAAPAVCATPDFINTS